MRHHSPNMVSLKKILGTIITTVGFLLSPVSWWNDIFVNIPLSYLLASFFNLFIKGYFSMFLILSYWLTNVLGLVLMHKGGTLVIGQTDSHYNFKAVVQDLKTSLIYSVIIAILVITHVLKLPSEYFH